MSGPKVVRVITREELQAAGEALLARLDAAFGDWERRTAPVGLSDIDRQASKDRRDALERLLREDKFGEFSNAAVDEISFLEVDAENRIERATRALAEEMSRLQSGRELAESLLRKLGPSYQERADLARAASGELSLKDLDSILSRARQAMFQPDDLKVTESQRALASRLGAGEEVLDFAAWHTRSASASPRVVSMLAHVASLELIAGMDSAAPLKQDIQRACAIEDEAVRGIQLDSLLVAIRRAKENALVIARLRRESTLLAAEAAHVPGGAQLVKALTMVGNVSQAELQTVVQDVRTRLAEIHAANAAGSRRRAVLSGLQQLGYEVNEQLSTATVNGGRIVVRSKTEEIYGVEITAGASMERMQVRTIAMNEERDASGDISAERRWCDDFSELQKRLKAQGTEVLIERALGVGTVPLKVLEASRSVDHARATAPVTARKL